MLRNAVFVVPIFVIDIDNHNNFITIIIRGVINNIIKLFMVFFIVSRRKIFSTVWNGVSVSKANFVMTSVIKSSMYNKTGCNKIYAFG